MRRKKVQDVASGTQETGYGRRVFPITFAFGINVLAYSIIYPFLPLYLHSERGIPMATVGLVFPVMGLATIIGSPLAGILADKIGRRLLLLWGPIGRSACFGLLAWMAYTNAPFWGFLIVLFFASLIGMFFRNAANAYVTDLVPPEKRTAAFSMLRIGMNVGWMMGPAIGAFLAQTPFAFLFGLTAFFLLLPPIIVFYQCPTIINYQKADTPKDTLSLIHILFGDRVLLALLSMAFLLFLSTSQFISTLSVFAKEEMAIAGKSLGMLFTINGAIVIVFQLPLNRLLKSVPLNVRMMLGALMYVVAYIGFAFSSIWLHLFFCIVVLTVGEIFTVTAIMAMVSRLAPTNRVGRYMGVFGLVQGVGWALGPYIGSLLFEPLRGQPLLLWGMLSSGAFVAGIGLLFIKEKSAVTETL